MSLKVRRVEVQSLKEDPANVRRHDDRNLAAIQSSIRTFGQVEPLVVQKDSLRVIGGNGRLRVLQRLGVTHVDVVEVDVDDAKAAQLSIALNRTGELAAWDEHRLKQTLEELASQGVDVEGLLHFTQQDMDNLLKGIVAPDTRQLEDPGVISLPKNPETKAGDVWDLSGSRLHCGDARDPKAWACLIHPKAKSPTLDARVVNLVVTSPPYADKRRYDEATGFRPIPPDEYVAWYQPLAENIKRHLAADGSYMMNIRAGADDGQRLLYTTDLLLAHARQWGFRFVDDFVWIHGGTPREAAQRFKNAYEPVYQFTLNPDHKFRPDRVMHETASKNRVGQDPGRDKNLRGKTSHPSQAWAGGSKGDYTPRRFRRVVTKPGGQTSNAKLEGGRSGIQPNTSGSEFHYEPVEGEDAPVALAGRGDAGRVLTQPGKPTKGGKAEDIEADTSTRSGAKWTYEKVDNAAYRDGKSQGQPGAGAVLADNIRNRVRRVGRPAGRPDGSSDPGAPGGGMGGIEVDWAYPSNVLSIGRNREALGHSAAFPINLPAFFIKAYTDPGDIVLDPFMGSGTTIIAAHQLGRRGYGIELSPGYCDITVQRWERLTGKTAKKVT